MRPFPLTCLPKTREPDLMYAVRYFVDSSRYSAEFALLVPDDWQNREVGHALVAKLTAFAAFVGLDAIHGVRSSANESMLGLTKKEALELPMSASIPLW